MFPKIFSIGPVTIYTYGLLTALGFILGIWLTARDAEREGFDREQIWDLGLIIIVAALIGSKVFMFLTEYDHYSKNPKDIFSLSTLQSGGVFFGGLIFSLLATAWYFNRKDLPGWKVSDLFAPGIAFGHAIGRIGCFAAGCCYGKPTSLTWGVTYTSDLANETVGVPLNVRLHPTQVYEAIAEFLIFVLLMQLRKRKSYDGQIILFYLVMYSAIRFLIEMFRGDAERGFLFNGFLSTSQFIGLLIIPAAIIMMFVRSKRAVPAYDR